MYRTALLRLFLALSLTLAACGGSDTTHHKAHADVGIADVGVDTALADAADTAPDVVADAGTDTVAADAAPSDVGTSDASTDASATAVPLDGFGQISGTCGILDDELTSPDPSYAINHIDFGTDPYDASDEPLLTDGGQRIVDTGNAGGNSLYSEAFSYELLHRCELATLLKTETEVQYTTTDSKITDLLVEIDGLKIGVSVTRAVAWPFDSTYTVDKASQLLTKKLTDIQDSSAHVAPSDKWQKQILYVIAYGQQHADAIHTAWQQLDSSVRGDTVVMVTVSDGDDAFLY